MPKYPYCHHQQQIYELLLVLVAITVAAGWPLRFEPASAAYSTTDSLSRSFTTLVVAFAAAAAAGR